MRFFSFCGSRSVWVCVYGEQGEGSPQISSTLPKTVRKWDRESELQPVVCEYCPTPAHQSCEPPWYPHPAQGSHSPHTALQPFHLL